MSKIIAIDLFSGAGGTTAGLKKSGINVQIAVEINPIASKTYEYNNPEVNLLQKDIREVTKEDITQRLSKNKEDFLMLVACPPCQGFSSIGSRDKKDERNQLIFEYERLILELKPEFLLMENVSGMSRGVGKELFNLFKQNISKDYDIVYDILNSADYGVPQTRKRLVVHGVRKDILKIMKKKSLELGLPQETHSQDGTQLTPWVNVDIILDLPKINAGEEYIGSDISNHLCNNLSDTNIIRIKHIRANGGSRESLPEELVLECHKRSSGHKDVYGVLNPNKPSVTITGGCMSY